MNLLSYKLFLTAFSNRTRFELINLLRKGPRSVTELCQKLGFEQSRTSHNLKSLELCGFVKSTAKGKKRIYSLEPGIVHILNDIDKYLVKYHNHIKTCGILDKHTASKLVKIR